MYLNESRRQIQVSEELMHAAGLFLARESNGESLITVTRADIAPDFKNATIFLSVLPVSQEERALDFAKRQRPEFRDYMKKHLKLKTLPFIDFQLDYGEKNRQNVDDALHR